MLYLKVSGSTGHISGMSSQLSSGRGMGCQALPDPEGGGGDGFALALHYLPQAPQGQQLFKALVLLPAPPRALQSGEFAVSHALLQHLRVRI